jgi:D-alanyl-D-alanine carboxypeptidase
MLLAISAAAALATAQQRLVSSHSVAGISTTLVVDGKIASTSVAGVENLKTGAPVTSQTIFRIGSITKLFTAVSVMQLVERGALRIDDPLAKFVPDFPNASKITIKELLMHRSGVPNYLDAALADGRALVPTTPAAIIAAAAKQPPDFAPGTDYEYSNTNYVLLGTIVESVSGMSLHAYYARNIFQVAQMKETFAGTAPADAAVATGYQLAKGNAPQIPGDSSWYYACGDILSTSDDVARFDIALMAGKLVGVATLDEMIAAAIPTGEGRSSYGLGVQTYPLGTKLLAGHHGGLPGFESDDEMIPSEHFAIVTLGNDFLYGTSTVLDVALSSYYPDDLALTLRGAAAANVPATAEPTELTPLFDSFFRSVLTGNVDSNHLDAAMMKALTASTVATIASAYAVEGAYTGLVFTGSDHAGQYRRYHYLAKFAKGNVPVTFVVDADGKIAGLANG